MFAAIRGSQLTLPISGDRTNSDRTALRPQRKGYQPHTILFNPEVHNLEPQTHSGAPGHQILFPGHESSLHSPRISCTLQQHSPDNVDPKPGAKTMSTFHSPKIFPTGQQSRASVHSPKISLLRLDPKSTVPRFLIIAQRPGTTSSTHFPKNAAYIP